MKKLIILLSVSMFLVSCGNNQNEMNNEEKENVPVVENNEAPVKEVLSEDEINAAINDLFSDELE